MTANDYLIGHLRDALAAAPEVGSLDVEVEVSNETIFLSGELDCASKRDAAAGVAARTAPGYNVVNEIKVLKLTPVEPAEVLHDSFGGNR